MTGERGSLRARAVRQLSALTAGRLAALAPVNAYTLPPSRLLIEQVLRAGAPPLRGTTTEAVAEAGVRGEWVRGPRAERADAAVLYVHGGGFVAGSAFGYRGVASRLSTATQLPVFTLDYRLAPEHPFPAAPCDVAAAFRWLTSLGYPPGRIVVAGDSAGGFLAAHLAIENAAAGGPQPGALVLFSPMADLRLALAAGHPGAHRDGLLSEQVARRAIAHFTDAPFALRPLDGMRLPPLLVHTGATEYFRADAEQLAHTWLATGAPCELRVWPDQMHAFQTLPSVVPESRTAYRAAARFVADHLRTAPAVVNQKVSAS
ncbi:alpha/beta hydrolase [Nocardia asteroides]|uniref:Carboxylesterase n=1 Tax=Nocardia asteroides NBRC 15531 TaxID=1110697 RepID=U5EI96_NOCAS|nr:alpha/beta hydrolase [Nocardia asteroides]UGT51351.1 alpha/beta hydrolase [Nocardia asteroides]GAD86073.1 putative carboxylesterase [Nocardia asteroides NBRC 15531]SFM28837.1 Acetyl esterase/lipase [Nocardia asteroides]VEG35764.1 Monoterpene epsilon-lactone hydrolase [Nocardia asteroides]